MNQLPELAWAGDRLGWGGQGRDRAVLLTGVAALAVAVIVVTAPVADRDSGASPWTSLRDASADLHWRSWLLVPVVAGLAGVHYLLAGSALRAAAGTRLGRWEATLAQLAAAAANRVVPAGLGAAAVNVRYLCRRGLTPAPAVGTVGAVGVLGALADGVLLLVVVLVGTWTGISGGRHELSAVGTGLWRLVDRIGQLPRPAQAALVLAVVVVVGCLRTLHRSRSRSRAAAAAAGSVAHAARYAAALRRRPRDLIVVMASSAGTTLVLGVAFAVCTVAASGATRDAGAFVVAYLVGAGAAAALPIPSGLGSTEAALVAALVAAHIRAGDGRPPGSTDLPPRDVLGAVPPGCPGRPHPAQAAGPLAATGTCGSEEPSTWCARGAAVEAARWGAHPVGAYTPAGTPRTPGVIGWTGWR